MSILKLTFKGQDAVNDFQRLETSLAGGDRLLIIPSMAGGLYDVA